ITMEKIIIPSQEILKRLDLLKRFFIQEKGYYPQFVGSHLYQHAKDIADALPPNEVPGNNVSIVERYLNDFMVTCQASVDDVEHRILPVDVHSKTELTLEISYVDFV